jgi:hypothetical protein
MEFNTYAITTITIILVIVSILYIGYFMYSDIGNVKLQIIQLQNEITGLIQKNLELTQELDEEDEEDDEEMEYDNLDESQILDQFMMNSDQLKHLQKLQSEIQSNPSKLEMIEEGDEENGEYEDIEGDEEEIPEIEFQTAPVVVGKCSKVLKTGKNAGQTCNKDTVANTEFCKSHSG